MKRIIAALSLLVLMGVAQARMTVPLVEPERVALASGTATLPPDAMKQSIIRGGAQHGWTVTADVPGKLTLKYNKQDKHEVVVDVSYDGQGFQIRYVSSTNMKFEVVDGVRKIHPFYNNWITNLSRAIAAQASTARVAQ